MTKLCERPGCSEPGAAAYGMVPEDLLFWIAPLRDAPLDQPSVLCQRHADAMRVPRGWTLDDRREEFPRLFRPLPRRPDAPAGAGSRMRRRRRTGEDAPEQLQIDGTGEIPRPVVEDEPDPTPARATTTIEPGDESVDVGSPADDILVEVDPGTVPSPDDGSSGRPAPDDVAEAEAEAVAVAHDTDEDDEVEVGVVGVEPVHVGVAAHPGSISNESSDDGHPQAAASPDELPAVDVVPTQPPTDGSGATSRHTGAGAATVMASRPDADVASPASPVSPVSPADHVDLVDRLGTDEEHRSDRAPVEPGAGVPDAVSGVDVGDVDDIAMSRVASGESATDVPGADADDVDDADPDGVPVSPVASVGSETGTDPPGRDETTNPDADSTPAITADVSGTVDADVTIDAGRSDADAHRPTDPALLADPSPDGSSEDDHEVVDQPVPWQPDFDANDDLDGLLEVSSPLLARAFRGTDRPRP